MKNRTRYGLCIVIWGAAFIVGSALPIASTFVTVLAIHQCHKVLTVDKGKKKD